MNHIRVSEILAQFRDFSNINPQVLNTKCNIGTEVHHNIHMHTKGLFLVWDMHPHHDFVTSEVNQWSERGQGYFDSYLKYEAKYKPKYDLMEKRFYDDNLMLTGQLDALMITDGLPTIVDFKCSYNVDEEIWGMQAHYYKHLLEHNGIMVGDKMLWLQLKKDGKMPKIVEINYDANVMSRCIQEAILYWEKKHDAKMLT